MEKYKYNSKATDVELGLLLKHIRLGQGLSQMKLAEDVGVSYQQIQKYEYGTSKLKVSRMIAICNALSFDPVVLISLLNRKLKPYRG